MATKRYQHTFSLTEKEENELILVKNKCSIADIIRAGLKWALKEFYNQPKENLIK